MELLNLPFPVLGLTGEVVERTTLDLQTRLDDIKHRNELGKHQNLVVFLTQLIEKVKERTHLRTLFLEPFRIDKTWMTTDLTQAHETLKDRKGILLHCFVGIETQKCLLNSLEFGLVEFLLDPLHSGEYFLFRSWREILGNLQLGPTEKEWA